jgi:FMN phosphatase YigB (HAD superfamily)
MGIRLVVTDMDNTLYSWVDYIVPAVEAMVDVVTRTTQWPQLKVIQSLKAVYTLYESNEYPFALQESSLYAEFGEFGSFDRLVIEPARAAFSHARRKYLQPYKSVVETLQTLSSLRIPVVALTDAPRNPAEQRIKKLGFDALFKAAYTMPGFAFPSSETGDTLVSHDIVSKEQQGVYRAQCQVIELPKEFEKPHSGGLERILHDFQVPARETLVVGDSLKKDITLAQRLGCVDAWAEYGTYVSLNHRERLDVISSNAITRRHAAGVLEGDQTAVKATYSLSNFGQILDIIKSAH